MQGKILIVDGISTNRIVLKVKLTAACYQVIQSGTLKEAVALVVSEKPDLVLTALTLPDGSAAQFCQILRADPHSAMVPVVAVGGDVDANTRLDTLRAGAYDVMDRPVNETLLLGRVRAMILAHHQLAEWQFRDDTSYALGLAEAPTEFARPASVTLIGLDAAPLQGWIRQMIPHLRARYKVAHLRDAVAGLHSGSPPMLLCLPFLPRQK